MSCNGFVIGVEPSVFWNSGPMLQELTEREGFAWPKSIQINQPFFHWQKGTDR